MADNTNIQKFGAYDLDEALAEQEALDQEGGGEFMKLAVGRNVVRILPPLRGKRSPFRVTYQHYIETADGKWVFTCPRLEARKRCPVCEKAQKMRASGNPSDRDEAYAMLPKRRVFCQVINRAEPEKGPVVLAFGKTIHEELVKLRRDEDTGGDFTHATNGIDAVIDRVGTGKNDTKYTVNLARRTSPIHDDATVVSEWADMMVDLDAYAKLPSDDELHERMAKVFGPDEVRTTGEDRPNRSRQRPAGPAQPRPRTAQQDVKDADYDEADDGEGASGQGTDGNADWGMPSR